MKNVVILGGGSGLSYLLKGVRNIKDINLSVIVTIADDGGSTGKIRSYYDIPAPGDLRRVVLSLSEHDNLEQLMNYRFDERLEKHTVGNLILAALTDIKGNMSDAVKEYCNILDVKENVFPLSNQSLCLLAQMKSGTLVYGESMIAKHPEKISQISYAGHPKATDDTLRVLKEADYIIFSCGSLFTSLLPNLTIEEVKNTINSSKAKVIYVANLFTQAGETDYYTLSNHVNVINKHLKSNRVDYVLANNNMDVKQTILKEYAEEEAYLVKPDDIKSTKCIFDNFILESDGVIRHNNEKLMYHLDKLMNGEENE